MKKINQNWAEFLKIFIPSEQLNELLEITEFDEITLLSDYTTYCHTADCLMNIESWNNYYQETLSFF
jgi:hypothetical protein